MAKDFPGFYFDTGKGETQIIYYRDTKTRPVSLERNRYFPLSSKPAAKTQSQSLTNRVGDPDSITPKTIFRRAGNSLCSRTVNQKLLSSPPSIVTRTRSLANQLASLVYVDRMQKD